MIRYVLWAVLLIIPGNALAAYCPPGTGLDPLHRCVCVTGEFTRFERIRSGGRGLCYGLPNLGALVGTSGEIGSVGPGDGAPGGIGNVPGGVPGGGGGGTGGCPGCGPTPTDGGGGGPGTIGSGCVAHGGSGNCGIGLGLGGGNGTGNEGGGKGPKGGPSHPTRPPHGNK
jgi:hypothetical protein